MSHLKLLHNEGLHCDWEVTQTGLHKVHVSHNVSHHIVKVLQVEFLSWIGQRENQLVGELVKQHGITPEIVHEVLIQVERIGQVLRDVLQVAVILNEDGILESVWHLAKAIIDDLSLAWHLQIGVNQTSFSSDEFSL